MYLEETNGFDSSQKTKTQDKRSFDDIVHTQTREIENVVWAMQLISGGYYDNVKIYKSESTSYIKIKFEVPEQEKNGARNSAKVCYVFDKSLNLVGCYHEYNTYMIDIGINENSVILIAKSSDAVPLVTNPETYECKGHKFDAGKCSVCD